MDREREREDEKHEGTVRKGKGKRDGKGNEGEGGSLNHRANAGKENRERGEDMTEGRLKRRG